MPKQTQLEKLTATRRQDGKVKITWHRNGDSPSYYLLADVAEFMLTNLGVSPSIAKAAGDEALVRLQHIFETALKANDHLNGQEDAQ